MADDLGEVERHEIKSKAHWLGLRGQDYTASDIGSLYGIGYRSALQVWAEKTGRVPPTEDNPTLRFGRWAQPMIKKALEEKFPMLEPRDTNIYLRSPSCRIGATPDFISTMREIKDSRIRYLPGYLVIEGKLVYLEKFKAEWCDDGATVYGGITPPRAFEMQVLLTTMLAERYLGKPCTPVLAPLAYSPGWADVYLVPVKKQPELEAHFIRVVDKFWSDTDAGIQPEIDEKKDADVLTKLYPGGAPEVDLRGHNEHDLPALFDERVELGHQESGAKKRRKEIKAIFQGLMGNSLYARLADGRRISLLPVEEAWVEGYVRGAYRALRQAKKGIGL